MWVSQSSTPETFQIQPELCSGTSPGLTMPNKGIKTSLPVFTQKQEVQVFFAILRPTEDMRGLHRPQKTFRTQPEQSSENGTPTGAEAQVYIFVPAQMTQLMTIHCLKTLSSLCSHYD